MLQMTSMNLIIILVLFEIGYLSAVRYYPARPDNYYNPKPKMIYSKQTKPGPLLFQPQQSSGPSGDPLFLTPLIEAGKIAEGFHCILLIYHN